MKIKKYSPTWEHIKLFIWVILIFELLLFCLALAVGKNAGFAFAFRVCFWLGLIIAAVFLSIFLLNFLGIVTFSFSAHIRGTIFKKKAPSPARVLNIYDFPVLKSILRDADHVDVKTVEGEVNLAEFIAAMLSFRPPWLIFFYRIRKVFVRLLGMRQDENPEMLRPLDAEDVPFAPGKTASFFIVRHASKDRFWIVETPDDMHLQAFLGIFKKKNNYRKNTFYVMTVVHYKHWTGFIYFNVIRPFHHLVVKQMALAGVK